jgi:hypothetical protein
VKTSNAMPDRQQPERRQAQDRRSATWMALWHGSFLRRRRGVRREATAAVSSIDWHHPQWLAVGLLILIFSCADALLTLQLLSLGAYEANPFMAGLVHGSGHAFALVKVGLTALGVVLLTLLASARVFARRVPVGALLYAVLGLYAALIIYELWLLELIRSRLA